MMDLSNVKGNMILIYVDQGVDGAALKHLVRSLKQEGHSVGRIDAQGLIATDWEKSAQLLIVPGGRDSFYHNSLKGRGTQKIRSFVAQGGSYLGICAGGYFGCDRIEFEKGEALEVCGERTLKFFPGVAKGPAYGNNRYSYESSKGAEAACISWADGTTHVYFNGGCYFEPEGACSDFQVLSRYLDLPGTPPAILKMQHGRGRVILSGVHFEYQASLFPAEDRFLCALSPLLSQAEKSRRKIFRDILTNLL